MLTLVLSGCFTARSARVWSRSGESTPAGHLVPRISGTAWDRKMRFEVLVPPYEWTTKFRPIDSLIRPNRKWKYGGLNPKNSTNFRYLTYRLIFLWISTSLCYTFNPLDSAMPADWCTRTETEVTSRNKMAAAKPEVILTFVLQQID